MLDAAVTSPAPAATHDMTPEPFVDSTSPLSPSSVGRVKTSAAPAAPAWRVVLLALVEFFKMIAPVFVLAVPRVREDAAVKVIEAKVGVELVAMD